MPSDLNIYKFIGVTFGSKISRALLSVLLRKTHDRRTRLYHALTAFAGLERPSGLGCWIDYLVLRTLIDVSSRVMRSKSELEGFRKYLARPSVRRALVSVIRGIVRYGVTTPQMLDAPFLVVWNFTNMCNLRCKHCYQRADKPLPDELTLEEKLELVRQLDEAVVAAIAFSGGEPLIHPHFLKVASEVSRRGIYVAVATNGTAITESMASKMRKAGVEYVEVSLDAANPSLHDKFRGVKGAWRAAVNGIENAVRAGFLTAIAMTVTKYNLGEVTKVIDLAEELGVDRVVFFNFIPVGRGEEMAKLDISPEEREELLKYLYEETKRRRVLLVSTAPQYSRVSLQLSGYSYVSPTHFALERSDGLVYLANYIGGCGAGRIYCAVQPNGDVTPCVFMPGLVVGNVREKKFKEIWDRSRVMLELRDRERLKPNCVDCKFKYVCGGCRARAYAYTGDVLGPDPGCIYNRKVYTRILSEIKLSALAPSKRL
ncbi:MAG: radical SAM/SPASM domain-containing protein [Thermoprotei archaeon]|nr:MAG: radical SAM/SPASM domain-containing protein [Thermoprotei archaeon]